MSLCPLTPTVGGRSCNTSIERTASTPHCAHLLDKSTRSQQPWCLSDFLWTLGLCSFSGHGCTGVVLLGTSGLQPFQQPANHSLLTPWPQMPTGHPTRHLQGEGFCEPSVGLVRDTGKWEMCRRIKGSNKNTTEKKKVKTSVSLQNL